MKLKSLIPYGVLSLFVIVGSVYLYANSNFSAFDAEPCLIIGVESGFPPGGCEPVPKDCEFDKQFPPAHDGVTATAQSAAVQKADGDSKTKLDEILNKIAQEADKYSSALKKLLAIVDGKDVDGKMGQAITDAFYEGVSTGFTENIALIRLGVMNPVTILEKSVYESLTLPKRELFYSDDPEDLDKERKWEFFSDLNPGLEGWPSNLRLTGLEFKALNYTSSNGEYSLCVEGGIGTANGVWNFNITGIKGKATLFSGTDGSVKFIAGFNGSARALLGISGSFSF